MSSCLEFDAKTVDKAVKKASETLNIPEGNLEYNVVSYGSTGIFGLVGVKKAKISVTIPDNVAIDLDEPAKKKAPSPKKNGAKKEKKQPRQEESTEESVSSLVREAFNLPEEEKQKPAKKSERKNGNGKNGKQPPKNGAFRKDEVPELDSESVILGRDALQRIIDFITTGAEITLEKGEDRVLYNVEGGSAGVLIGKRGQTLEAIQYLVEKIVNRHSEKRVRIQIDVEGYLDNRRSNLESLARRMAEKAKATGRPSTIGQMNAHDRRIIHLALKNDTGVRTQSVGDGFYRKLVIFPKKRRKKRP